jgi:probable biosynthetic protein (TIGR04098 family)
LNVLIEESELTISRVGLGRLTEYAALTLFGDAQSHALTAGTGGTLRDVVDARGAPLYPGYLWTHLTVPSHCRLERLQVWDRVAVEVEVRSWGPMLESSYVLGTPAELARPRTERSPLVCMEAASIFVVDARASEPQPSVPRKGTVAELPKLSGPPSALTLFRDARARGAIDPAFHGPLRPARPLAFPIVAGRDVAFGRHLVFAEFSRLFDLAERELLSHHLRPPIHDALIDHLSVLDRQIAYVDNCAAGAVVDIDVAARIERCAPSLGGDDGELTAAAILELAFSMHEQPTGKLLALATAKKLLLVPRTRPSLLNDAERFCQQHGNAR